MHQNKLLFLFPTDPKGICNHELITKSLDARNKAKEVDESTPLMKRGRSAKGYWKPPPGSNPKKKLAQTAGIQESEGNVQIHY